MNYENYIPGENCALSSVSLSQIDMTDTSLYFRFFKKPSQAMVESVKRYGILSPPLLYISNAIHKIIDGFRRIEAAKINGLQQVSCLLIDPPPFKEDLARLSLSLFLSSGPPHCLDEATILIRMTELLGQEETIHCILPLWGRPTSLKVYQRLAPLAGLGDKLGTALLEGRINQDMALRLMGFDMQTRDEIGSLLLSFGFSQSKQFEILENLTDISAREGMPITDLLHGMGWKGSDKEEEGKNKAAEGEAFRQKIRKMRYPVLSGMEEEWREKVKDLRTPPDLSLSPPPYFEGGAFRLAFSFKNFEGFRRRVAEVKALEDDPSWKSLFQ